MMTTKIFSAIDLGATHTRFTFYDGKEFIASEKYPTQELLAEGPNLKGIISRYQFFLKQLNIKTVALCIGLPALMDKTRKIVVSAPLSKSLDGLNVVKILEKELGIPVFAERDVNFQLYYDIHLTGRIPHVALGVYLGTGVGNAAWINGFYTGAHGSAAELGHIPVAGATGVCACGNVGCLETVCCGRWLSDWHKREVPDLPISEIFLKMKDHPDIKRFVQMAAFGVATAINIMDPEIVFLGGGVFQMPHYPLEETEKLIIQHTRAPVPRDFMEIKKASDLSDSGSRGGCLFAAQHFKNV